MSNLFFTVQTTSFQCHICLKLFSIIFMYSIGSFSREKESIVTGKQNLLFGVGENTLFRIYIFLSSGKRTRVWPVGCLSSLSRIFIGVIIIRCGMFWNLLDRLASGLHW
jgi:hypothetical protein